MQIEELTREMIDSMDDEEIALCYGKIKRQEQVKSMKRELLNYIDLQEVNDRPRTIKIDSKVID